MSISYEAIRDVTASLYERSLKKIPEDTKDALRRARDNETNELAKKTLTFLLNSAEAAETKKFYVCSDNGIPVYFVRLGSEARIDGSIKKAIKEGFARLVENISPPLMKHVTNPLTLERGYAGKDMPAISFDMIDDVDYVEIICQPKALGSGRWADLEVFSFPSLEEIEKYVMEVVMRAGSQHCPPVMIGVGIGGTFDYAAKMAKEASLRPYGSKNPEPILAAMEERLFKAVNKTGFGPMGTGGDTTALGVHINYASGHGFTPVAVCFNCWINRRLGARINNAGEVTYFE